MTIVRDRTSPRFLALLGRRPERSTAWEAVLGPKSSGRAAQFRALACLGFSADDFTVALPPETVALRAIPRAAGAPARSLPSGFRRGCCRRSRRAERLLSLQFLAHGHILTTGHSPRSSTWSTPSRPILPGGQAVALGFECPLFVPVPEQALRLGAARPGEKNRSWSAGRGRWGDRDWHRRSGVGTEYRAGEVGDPRWLVVARTARYG
jgi:hypothetical protein